MTPGGGQEKGRDAGHGCRMGIVSPEMPTAFSLPPGGGFHGVVRGCGKHLPSAARGQGEKSRVKGYGFR